MMGRRAALLAALLAMTPRVGAAQAWAAAPPGAPPPESAAQPARNELALEIGVLAAGLSYARRIGDTPLSAGAGLWGAWEPPTTFDRNVWEPIGLFVFGRYRPAPWLHADVGVTGARYLWADDCSGCTGTFAGVRSAVLVGYRFAWIGPEASVGVASDDRDGPALGVIWGVQARFTLGWGR